MQGFIQVSATQRNRRKRRRYSRNTWFIGAQSVGVIFTGLVKFHIRALKFLSGNHNGIVCVFAVFMTTTRYEGWLHPCATSTRQATSLTLALPPSPEASHKALTQVLVRALKDQAVRVPTWVGKLKLSSELPRTAVAGVQAGEQLAPASLPWRTPHPHPACPRLYALRLRLRRTRALTGFSSFYRHLGLWLEHRKKLAH